MPDPNFQVRTVKAIWSICGPYRRQALAREGKGTVFFVPHSPARRKLGLPPVCTGVLVVDKIIPDSNTLIKSSQFSKTFKDLYKKDLQEHLKRDRPATKKIRRKNIVLGSPKSHWFGKRCVKLLPLLRRLKLRDVAYGVEHDRVVRSLSDAESKRLYQALVKAWRSARPIETRRLTTVNHEQACRVCY